MRLEDMTPEDKANYGLVPLSRHELKLAGFCKVRGQMMEITPGSLKPWPKVTPLNREK